MHLMELGWEIVAWTAVVQVGYWWRVLWMQ